MTTSGQRDGRGGPAFSLIFPTYNPGPALDRALRELEQFAAASPDPWEFVFVCDGCVDGTPERLKRWSPPRGTARVLSYGTNRGKGYAVRQGLLAAAAPFRIFTDIDLAYGFDDIRRVAAALRTGRPMVIASRAHLDSVVQLPARTLGYAWRRHLQSRLFGALTRSVLPVAQRDTQAGLKGMSEAAVRSVVPRLRSDGFEFDCELLTACARLGIEITEVPVCVRYDGPGTTTGWRIGFGMARSLWRIRRDWPAVVAEPPFRPHVREAA